MADLLQGQDIAKLLRSEGPVVTCVLLRAQTDEVENRKQSANLDSEAPKREALVDWIEQVEVDTTPKKSMVSQILGGPFTFLGQYEEEGIILMVRRPEDDEDEHQKNDNLLPLNPHKLQPPFDEAEVRGDILIVRVAPTPEELDDKNDDAAADPQQASLEVLSNEEFFKDYTKEEYIQFASRTDIVAPEIEEASEEEEVSEEEDDAEDEEYNVAEDLGSDEEDEDEPLMMMNLLMGQVLKRFREENGRGPNSEELLNLRAVLAQKLGIELPPQVECDESPKRKKIVDKDDDENSPSRSILVRKRIVSAEDSDCDGDSTGSDPETKRVKFSHHVSEQEEIAPAGPAVVKEAALASTGEP